jgi:uncharacterized protein YerC
MQSALHDERCSKVEQREALYKTIPLIETPQEAEEFLEALLSPDEIERAARRWCCARQLLGGAIQRVAVESCCASRNMVTRVNLAFIKKANHISRTLYSRFNTSQTS